MTFDVLLRGATALALSENLKTGGFLNRSSARCGDSHFTQSLECWEPEPEMEWILSCCKGSDDPTCWSGTRTKETCCDAFLPQVMAQSLADTVTNETFQHLQLLQIRKPVVTLIRKLFWSCLDFFPGRLRKDLKKRLGLWQTILAVLSQGMWPLTGRQRVVNEKFKLVINHILLSQRKKVDFVQSVSWQKDCVIDVFSKRCEKPLPIFQRMGLVEGPNPRDAILDFSGVSTAREIYCNEWIHACDPLSRFYQCTADSRNWGRLPPFLEEEYFEWQDVLETAWGAAQRGDHFAMAEVGAGPYGIWAVRAAKAFLRWAPEDATCDLLLVEPKHLDHRLLQDHLDRNLAGRCRVVTVEEYVTKPHHLLQLLRNHSRSGYWDLVDIDADEGERFMLKAQPQYLAPFLGRLHISTHARTIHGTVKSWFRDAGWKFTTDFAPFSLAHDPRMGRFLNCDGRLSVQPVEKMGQGHRGCHGGVWGWRWIMPSDVIKVFQQV